MSTEHAFAAGLFEGEGTITISLAKSMGRKDGVIFYTRPVVTLTSTDESLARFFHDRWGGQFRMVQPKRGNAKCAWTWVLNAKVVIRRFLDDIEPFVHSDRMKARIALLREDMACRDRRKRKNQAYLDACHERLGRMRVLNHRGAA